MPSRALYGACRNCGGELVFLDNVRGQNDNRIPLNPDLTRHSCPERSYVRPTFAELLDKLIDVKLEAFKCEQRYMQTSDEVDRRACEQKKQVAVAILRQLQGALK